MNRWFGASIILAVVAASLWGYSLYQREARLSSFCSELPLGRAINEVREDAKKHGLVPRMEPYAQMRVEDEGWPFVPKSPACRVFFNRERTVEYRIPERS